MTVVVTEWEIVVGLEVHCELRSATKLFCGCPNVFGSPPNTNICPVCLGLPGSLPVINEMAVELAMRVGTALGCTIQRSTFARKNYFYPDMPKDYQISQYDEPINIAGQIELADGTRIGIVRAHLEEDTGKTTHVGGGGRIHDADYSLVDYNRAGVPLVEIVSEPDIRSAEQAHEYVTELRAILIATGASDGRMEEGSLRIDANVSVRPVGSTAFGTRCEVKNLNSLRSLGRAIDYEAARQIELLGDGGRVVQETRHWNEDAGSTSSLRSKEEAFDYRYFAEPDLVPLAPDAEWVGRVAGSLDLLPAGRRQRLAGILGAEAAGRTEQIVTAVSLGLDDLVVAVVAAGAEPKIALARVANEAAAEPEAARRLDIAAFARMLSMEQAGTLSATQSKVVLAEMLASGGEPEAIAARLGFEALGDDTLEGLIDELIARHQEEWERYVGGDEKVAQFLLGVIIRETKGRANGKAVAASFARRRG